MQGVLNKSNYLINSLENLLHSFEAENKDDANCRQLYQNMWTSQRFYYKWFKEYNNS